MRCSQRNNPLQFLQRNQIIQEPPRSECVWLPPLSQNIELPFAMKIPTLLMDLGCAAQISKGRYRLLVVPLLLVITILARMNKIVCKISTTQTQALSLVPAPTSCTTKIPFNAGVYGDSTNVTVALGTMRTTITVNARQTAPMVERGGKSSKRLKSAIRVENHENKLSGLQSAVQR